MELITTIIGAIVISFVSSWITVQLSLRRFQAEKWWEIRVNTYKQLIGAFHDCKVFSETYWNAEQDGWHWEISNKDREILSRRFEEAMREIKRATDLAGFLLSDEALTRLKKFQKERREAIDEGEFTRMLFRQMKVSDSCLQDLIEIARRDLKTGTLYK